MGVYAQYAGEDEAGGLPSKKMYLAGVDYSSSYQNTARSNSIPNGLTPYQR